MLLNHYGAVYLLNSRINFFLIILMAGIVCLGGCIILQSIDAISWSQYKEYDRNNDTFTLNYPSDWRIVNGSFIGKKDATLIELYPPSDPLDYSSKFTIGTELLRSDLNLSQYSDESINILNTRLHNFKLIDSVSISLSNMVGERVLYTHQVNGRIIQIMQIWLLSDSNVYILTFATKPSQYPYYLPLLNKMVTSLKISNQQEKITSSTIGKSINYINSGNFEIPYPSEWKIDSRGDRVSILSNPTSLSDHHLERLDIYFKDTNSSSNNDINENILVQDSLLFDEINYLRDHLSKVDLLSIRTMNFSQSVGKELTYRYESNIGPTLVKEYLLIHGPKYAILVFSAGLDEFDDISTQVDFMIRGFKFR